MRDYSFIANQQCTGCLACYNSCDFNAINIRYDEKGFIRPVRNPLNCKNCLKCFNSCPNNVETSFSIFNTEINLLYFVLSPPQASTAA